MKPVPKQYLFISAVFVIVITVISIFLPRERAVNIDFVEGKPWRYDQLTAPFDFAVAKSETALERERIEVLAAQRPYYTREALVGEAAVDSFTTFYKRELHYIVDSELSKKITTQLHHIYDNGIIGSNDLARLSNDSISTIMLIEQYHAKPVKVEELYTVQQAYERLMAIDTTRCGRSA